jgi:hypothetical protein
VVDVVMGWEQDVDLGEWRKCPDQDLQACRVRPKLKGANLGIVVAVVLVVRVICHFDQPVTQATMDQNAHVWQTSVCFSHSLGIAILVVYSSYKLEWLRRI